MKRDVTVRYADYRMTTAARGLKVFREEIVRGRPVYLETLVLNDKEYIETGGMVRTVRLKEEWLDDVRNPEESVRLFGENGVRADIFTFAQRLPESRPRYDYFMEWDNVAAIPVSSYERWVKDQIHENARNKIRIAEKKGVEVRLCELDDDLLDGITVIYNETPVRQGKKYWNYGMDRELAEKENASFRERSWFIGAYCGAELIGFLKLVDAGRYARTMGIISKLAHRDKAPTNLLLAKAVQVCVGKGIPFLVYGRYDYGKLGSDSLLDFKRYNGFEHIILPRYFIPLTLWGRIAIRTSIHKGLINMLPEGVLRSLRATRSKWYGRKI